MTRATETVERIKQFITTSGLQAGDCLPSESDLCDSLGVSRSSVREAVRTLSTLDIVEVQHGRGTFVGNAPPSLGGDADFPHGHASWGTAASASRGGRSAAGNRPG
ncbi:MAG: FadR family transcriptional regulator [Propionibacterium sp.]|nr:FadR family transcriptional regulator [Propionibacterium sp.]